MGSSFDDRSDIMSSSSSGGFSRDMDYILEDYDFKELPQIKEDNKEDI